MQLPEIGEPVMLYPAPRADVEHPDDKPPTAFRRVQDGSGNYGRFLPEEGAKRAFDTYWHDRLYAGDVCLSDPRKGYRRGQPVKPDANASATPTK